MSGTVTNRSDQGLIYINIIRLTLYTLFLIVSLALFISQEYKNIWLISICVIAFSLVWTLFHNRILSHFSTRSALYSFLIIDILTITLLVYISGGNISPLYFLYLFPIILSASFMERRDTVVIASLAFIMFGSLSDLIYLGILPSFVSERNAIPFSGFIYNLSMAFFSFLVVAVLSSFYFQRIHLAKKELDNAVANLKDLLELNSTLLDQIEDGFFTADGNRKIISYNKKAKTLLNYDETKKPIQELLHSALQRLTPDENYTYFEYELQGRSLGVSINRLKNVYSFSELFIFVIHDLTERRIIEQELRKKEHMALIGEISAGMAHELRNPLASISGSVQYLQKRLKMDDDTGNLMQIIVTETQRLSKSIEDFLLFSREKPLHKTTFNLTELLNEMVQITEIANQGNVKLRKDYLQHAVWLNADYEKIRQLIQNLISNSVKAIEKSGDIIIALDRRKSRIRLSVKDQGIGMDSESIKEVFTPFFSKFSKGIGLGMAIVKKIVDEHQFDIDISSERGRGTEVTIWME